MANLFPISEEQRIAIAAEGSLRIDACAGSGKTTLLIEYARARPNHRILYLAYNRPVRIAAQARFRKAGCPHVRASTIHGLAYHGMKIGKSATLTESGNYSITDILNLCNIPELQNRQEIILAHHIRNLLHWFFCGTSTNIYEIDYHLIPMTAASKAFVERYSDAIYGFADSLWIQIREGTAPLSHDAYLKLYALSNPSLPETIILLDEAQDSNPVTLRLLSDQHADLVAVGDSNQGIYGFRGAINALETLDSPSYRLSKSWRFGPHIAFAARRALSLKVELGSDSEGWTLQGSRRHPPNLKTHAILARSNARLLSAALDQITEGIKAIHFEGGFNSYTYIQQGPSIYDLLSLAAEKHHRVRNPVYAKFRSLKELSEYAIQAGDHETQQLIDLVWTYGGGLPQLLKMLKHMEKKNACEADVSFATIHKAKGAEYGSCEVLDDFVSAKIIYDFAVNHLDSQFATRRGIPLTTEALNEEINMLYTAITRAQADLQLPTSLLEVQQSDIRPTGTKE